MSSADEVALGLFPLGLVLLPGEVLPLHIFEERYKLLVRERLDGGEFGVVLADDGTLRECGCTARVAELLEELGHTGGAPALAQRPVVREDDAELAAIEPLPHEQLVALLEDVERQHLAGQQHEAEREQPESDLISAAHATPSRRPRVWSRWPRRGRRRSRGEPVSCDEGRRS